MKELKEQSNQRKAINNTQQQHNQTNKQHCKTIATTIKPIQQQGTMNNKTTIKAPLNNKTQIKHNKHEKQLKNNEK